MRRAEQEKGVSTKVDNVWPSQDLPLFEGHFKALGRTIHQVGLELARHLDHYVESHSAAYEKGKLRRVISNRDGVVGRLLHYFA